MRAISKEDLIESILEIIATARPRLKGAVKSDTPLSPGMGFDSLAFIETLIGIEERFDLSLGEFEEFDAARVVTVNELADFVLGKIGTVSHA